MDLVTQHSCEDKEKRGCKAFKKNNWKIFVPNKLTKFGLKTTITNWVQCPISRTY